MIMHPANALRGLAATIAPTRAEVYAARKRFDTIKARLEQSFEAKRFMAIGSHARGNAIRYYS
jgi:hypothetical protein